MTVSDIITLLTLVIAIFAIISEKSRKHLRLKFSIIDYCILFFAFALVNYFVYYESFKIRGLIIPFLYFDVYGLTYPQNWAYPISIFCLLYLSYKIWCSFFPNYHFIKVIRFYKDQIDNNEITYLVELLERYHKNDIIKYINESRDYNSDIDWLKVRFHRVSKREKLNNVIHDIICYIFPVSRSNRNVYAKYILFNIIDNPTFISLAANKHPYLFADIFKHFKKNKRGSFPRDLMKSYFEELIRNKNYLLKQELITCQKFDREQPEWFYGDNKILTSLFADLAISEINEIWIPFGEMAKDELDKERLKGEHSILFQEYISEQILWNFQTYYAILFFKYLIIEAIVKQYRDSHFWLYYYDRIISKILKNIFDYSPEFPPDTTNYDKLIETIIENLFLWLDLAIKHKHQWMFYNVIRCIGDVTTSLIESPLYYEKRKVQLVKKLLHQYCNLDDNEDVEKVRSELETVLLKPSRLMSNMSSYIQLLNKAWKEVDKFSHKSNGFGQDFDYFKRLKEKVIIPLSLNPDEG